MGLKQGWEAFEKASAKGTGTTIKRPLKRMRALIRKHSNQDRSPFKKALTKKIGTTIKKAFKKG